MEPYDALHACRHSLYGCLHRRADALFELTDALLCAEAIPSPVHLSLQASHRRGWGSLYAALRRGRVDAEALRELLAHYYPLAGSGATPPVYAVDASVWPRCDAQTSPDRGHYYHPSRHSAGGPIVAGWAYLALRTRGADLNPIRPSAWSRCSRKYALLRSYRTGFRPRVDTPQGCRAPRGRPAHRYRIVAGPSPPRCAGREYSPERQRGPRPLRA